CGTPQSGVGWRDISISRTRRALRHDPETPIISNRFTQFASSIGLVALRHFVWFKEPEARDGVGG
ncbi:hypothetical protein, partial [Methylobacterium fujisawaense]